MPRPTDDLSRRTTRIDCFTESGAPPTEEITLGVAGNDCCIDDNDSSTDSNECCTDTNDRLTDDGALAADDQSSCTDHPSLPPGDPSCLTDQFHAV